MCDYTAVEAILQTGKRYAFGWFYIVTIKIRFLSYIAVRHLAYPVIYLIKFL